MNKQDQKRILERYFRALSDEGKLQAFLYSNLQQGNFIFQQASEYEAMYSFNKRIDLND
jgi:hypothetical protein